MRSWLKKKRNYWNSDESLPVADDFLCDQWRVESGQRPRIRGPHGSFMTTSSLPQHIAIVMDGNGRWAEKRKRPRTMGHQAGVRALRKTVEHAIKCGIQTLSVFAFSSENWKRPAAEVKRLMELFMRALDKEVDALRDNGVKLRFVGDLSAFSDDLRERMDRAEKLTFEASTLTLNVAVNYGGRWDITQAAKAIAHSVQTGRINPEEIDEEMMSMMMATGDSADPDLFIRTGGEMRISNFLLWQSAYAELYFTPVLWPDFNAAELDMAIKAYQQRERRFGLTGEQLKGARHA